MIKAEDNIALKSTKDINDTATSALSKANSAKDIADNTNQYFWHASTGSDTGAHITEKTQEAFLADPQNGGGNLLARSNGIAVRDGLTELASFGANGMKIGKTDEKHIEVTSTAFNVYDEDGSVPFSINTMGSARTSTASAWFRLEANETWSDNIYLKGVIVDNKLYCGTSVSGQPTFTNYIENIPTDGTAKSITVDGVRFTAYYLGESVIRLLYSNTNSSARNCGYRIPQKYYETSIKVNDAVLEVTYDKPSLVDITGVCDKSFSFAYKYGKVVSLTIGVYNTNSIAPGGEIYRGNLTNLLVPQSSVSLIGSKNGAPFIGLISSTGFVQLTNTSTRNIATSASSPIILTATYVGI